MWEQHGNVRPVSEHALGFRLGYDLRSAESWPTDHTADTWPWHRTRVGAESFAHRTRPVDRFHSFCEAVVARLPFGLGSVIAPTFLGFCLINGVTFGVDLAILTALRSGLSLPVPVAVTIAYAAAFALSYLLNRTFNFQSHAPVGPQVGIYVAVVAINYLAFILGVSACCPPSECNTSCRDSWQVFVKRCTCTAR